MNDTWFVDIVFSKGLYCCIAMAVLIFILLVTVRIMELVLMRKTAVKAGGKKDGTAGEGVAEAAVTEGVSVILTVHNDLEATVANLKYYLDQDYPDYEVIVVDEISEDGTLDTLVRMASENPHLHVSRLFPGVKFLTTKKIALNIGILAARHDLLLFADINYRPQNRNWVRGMAANFKEGVVAVTGTGLYAKGKHKIELCRYLHNLHTVKFHIMNLFGMFPGNDFSNFGFRKSVYMEMKGYSWNNHHIQGYENEIIVKSGELGEVVISTARDTFLLNADETNGHGGDIEYYYCGKRTWPLQNRIFADIPFYLAVLLYAAVFFLLYYDFPLWFVLALFLFLFFIDIFAQNLIMRCMGQKNLFLTSIIMNTFYPCIRFYNEINATFNRRKK